MPAQAGRPLQTDDAGVVERGACEIEAAGSRDSAAGNVRHLSTVQLACGAPASSELAAAAYRWRDAGATAHAIELGGKTQLSSSGPSSALSLSYGVAWARPDSQSWRHAATRVGVVHTRSLPGDSTLHVNLGHVRHQEDRRSATTWGIALEHAGAAALVPMAELVGDDRNAPCWNLGLRWTPFSIPLSFDMAYGQQLTAGRPRVLAIGLTQAF